MPTHDSWRLWRNMKQSSAPATEPLTTAEAKTHLVVDHSDDDTYIDTLVAAARAYVEQYTGRQLVTATWTMDLERFPGDDFIQLPFPPLQSVTSVKYYDLSNSQQTLAASKYVVADSTPGRLRLVSGEAWPQVYPDRAQAVEVIFVAGYGAASAVPADIKHAIKMLVGHWYENRETVTVGQTSKPVAFATDALLNPYKIKGVI